MNELATTASGTLAILPATKEEITFFASKLLKEVKDGNVNPLDVAKYRKCMEKVFETIKSELDPLVRDEAEKYGKSFEYKGMKIELCEVGTKYDFSQCGDTQLYRMQEQLAELSQKVKDRQDMIKKINGSMDIIDTDTGQVNTVYPPIKTSTSSVKITV